MATITIRISKQGKAEISVNGVKGEGCRELTRRYVERAGGTVESDTPTAEMYETAETETGIDVGGR